jgi:hypothetical protein
MTASSLSAEQLRQQIRIRLTQGRLPVVNGVYKIRPGTGRPCMVCRRAVESPEIECETGVVQTAHYACYTLWRAESESHHAARHPS